MKSLFLALLLVLAQNSLADTYDKPEVITETEISSFKTGVFNDVWKKMFDKEMKVTYVTVDETAYIFIYLEDTLGTSIVCLTEEQTELILSYIKKFNEWKKKAAAKGLSLEKEIGTLKSDFSKYSIGYSFNSCAGVDIDASFFTQPNKTYQFVLSFGPMNECSALEHRPEARYMGTKQVEALGKALSKGAIERAIAKRKRKKAVEDEFK